MTAALAVTAIATATHGWLSDPQVGTKIRASSRASKHQKPLLFTRPRRCFSPISSRFPPKPVQQRTRCVPSRGTARDQHPRAEEHAACYIVRAFELGFRFDRETALRWIERYSKERA